MAEMKFKKYKYLVLSDLYRITGNTGFLLLIRQMVGGSAYKYLFWMRTCNYAFSSPFLKFLLYPIARLALRRLTFKLGISIPWQTNISSGFFIGHFFGIVVNANCCIGKNCNISHGVTLGQANRGKRRGSPSLGDNVYIGPGAKLIGAIRVGDNVAIGANCVVVKDVPDGAVVVGIPARVVSQEGSAGYVNRTDYDKALRSGL